MIIKYIYKKMRFLCIFICLIIFSVAKAGALQERTTKNTIETKELRTDSLYLSQTTVPLEQVINQLPNRASWESFSKTYKDANIYIDPRSGKPASIIVSIPLIPGTGSNNNITIETLSRVLGHEITNVGKDIIKDVALKFLKENESTLNINTQELMEIRVGNPVDYLWQVFVTRQLNGIPIRDANIILTINHGNLVLLGAEKWGDIIIDQASSISKERALQIGFDFIGGQLANDIFIKQPHLEIIPVASNLGSTIGNGYEYILVWAYTFQRKGYLNTWEMLIDAHSGQLISFQDTNQYLAKKIVGAIYPWSNDECGTEGSAVNSAPMPYTDTGFAAPNNFTSLNGLYNYASGTATTTLSGTYVDVADWCGTISESSTTGDLDLGGTNGQHDCIRPAGHSNGDTFAARTTLFEMHWMNQIANGWASYPGLTTFSANVNVNMQCNAINGPSIDFYRSGGGCRNAGEIAGVLDHEWGHNLDSCDINATMSNPPDGFADAVAALRAHKSCVAKGYFWTWNKGCGQWTCPSNPSSTGYNCNGYGDCCMNCTGVRESDYAQHASGNAHTPINFTCINCGAGAGLCGKEMHCEGPPVAESLWDIAGRDLQAPPFNLDRQSAFEIAIRLLFIGSGNVTNWYACNCANGTSNGCGANAGYMQFVAADDDDGNISNGTPHMTAIYSAFNRHGIACASPVPSNSGCADGPVDAPVLTAIPLTNGVQLYWNSVPNAANYYVFKSTGPIGCDFGKAKIATVSGTTFTDEAMDCFPNHYMIMPVGNNISCLAPTSNCISVTSPYSSPANVTATPTAPNQVTVNWSSVPGAIAYNVYRRFTQCGSIIESKIASNVTGTSYIDNTVMGSVTYYYSVTSILPQCESGQGSWVQVIPSGACYLNPCFNGVASIANNQSNTCSLTLQWNPATSSCPSYSAVTYDIYRSTDPAFIPSPSNMIAQCQNGTSYTDSTVDHATRYYYIARAEDSGIGGGGPCNGGNIDTNLMRKNAVPTGPIVTTFTDDFESGMNNWTISSNWQQSTANPNSGIYSAWSNSLNNQICDLMTQAVPIVLPASAYMPTVHFWSLISLQTGNDAGIVEGSANGSNWAKLSMTPNYPGSTNSSARACLGINPQPAFTGFNPAFDKFYTADISSFAGGNFQVRFNCATDASVLWQGWFIDDVSIDYASFCATGNTAPGSIMNNLMISKSGNDLVLQWTAPASPCVTSDYGIYRGILPWTGYNHASITCNTGGTNYITPVDNGSYYFLSVAQNESNEGSYGMDYSGNQRPAASSPCLPQSIGTCN